MVFTIEDRCPKCGKMPHRWVEEAKFRSREMHWIGCKKDGLLEGGYTEKIAQWNWARRIARIKHEALSTA